MIASNEELVELLEETQTHLSNASESLEIYVNELDPHSTRAYLLDCIKVLVPFCDLRNQLNTNDLRIEIKNVMDFE